METKVNYKKLDLNDPLFSMITSKEFHIKHLGYYDNFKEDLNYDNTLEEKSDEVLYNFLIDLKIKEDRIIMCNTRYKFNCFDVLYVDDNKKVIYLIEFKIRDYKLSDLNYNLFLEKKKYEKLQKVRDYMLNYLQTYSVKSLYINYISKNKLYSVIDITDLSNKKVYVKNMNKTTASSTLNKIEKEIYYLDLLNDKKIYNYKLERNEFSTDYLNNYDYVLIKDLKKEFEDIF
jgi:hypothetical protein